MSSLALLFASVLAAVGIALGAGQDLRKWTDVTGRFTIEARFTWSDGQYVVLERPDGVKLKIEIARLSQLDREYLKSLLEENPFQIMEGQPQQGAVSGPASGPNVAGQSQGVTTPGKEDVPDVAAESATGVVPYFAQPNAPLVAIDWAKVQPVIVDPTVGWKLKVPKPKPVSISPGTIALPPKSDFFEKVAALAVSPVTKLAFVQYTLDRPGQKEKSSRIVLCDLSTGKIRLCTKAAAEMLLLAVHPSGKFILTRRNEFGFGNRDRAEICRVDIPKDATLLDWSMTPQYSWTPYESERGLSRDVVWAKFADELTLVMCSGMGKISVWNCLTMQPVCYLETGMGAIPAISPDGQWLAFATRDQHGIFSLRTRSVVALQNTDRPLAFPVLAFSPSGNKLGCLNQKSEVLVWDVGSGKLQAEFAPPQGVNLHPEFIFPDDDFVLGGKRLLIHPQSQLVVWEYQNLELLEPLGDLTCVVTSMRQAAAAPIILSLVRLPHTEAQAVLEQALKKPQNFVFRKGVSVKLDLSAVPEDSRELVRGMLKDKLAQMDCPISDSAQVTIAAGVSGPTERTVSYMHSGEYKVQVYETSIKILYQDRVLWQSSGGGVPFMLMLKEGENVGSKLRELTGKPNYEWFKGVELPKYLQKPAGTSGAQPASSIALGTGPLPIARQSPSGK